MDLTTSVPEASLVPTVFGLSQNYPNPFNPTTRIKYTLPEQSTVSLKIYNLLGQEMVSIASGVQEAGFYELTWDGHNSRGTPVGSGVYFYRFEAKGASGKKFTDLKKMLFLK
jgi:flagellar hook assembly protein FlgD